MKKLLHFCTEIRYSYLFSSARSETKKVLITLRGSLNKTTESEKRVVEMEKDTQRKYFKHHSITREDYDKLMLKYREHASDLKEKTLILRKKLA